MRTEAEIRDQILELTNELEKMGPTATVNINAPLALLQLAKECRINMLKWVLMED